jgi:cell division control protein 6
MVKENVFARRREERHIFKDERVLSPEFLPEDLPHRDSEIQSLVYALRPLAEGKNASHVFVYGPPGTGKTVTLKFVTNQLKEFSNRVKPVFLNCFEFNTRQAVLAELTKVVERPVPSRGMSTSELYSKVLEGIKFAKFVPVLVFDEFDQLLFNDGNELLYDVLRIPEQGYSPIPIVVISNDVSILSKFDGRVRSSFGHETVEFEPYSPVKLKDILLERAGHAFFPETLSEEALGIIAANASKRGGDCRVAIETLRKAGKHAERDNAAVILAEHAQAALEDEETSATKKAIPFLSASHKIILQSIFELGGKGVASHDLYASLESKGVVLSDRRVRELLVDLERKKAISTKTDTSGRGRTKKITANFPESSLK